MAVGLTALFSRAPGLKHGGGEGGIRTLEGLLTLTPLAGARLRPLGHLSRQAMSPIAERAMIPAPGSLGKAKGGQKRFLAQASSTTLTSGEADIVSGSSSRLMRS
jgi:hypothetical protein